MPVELIIAMLASLISAVVGTGAIAAFTTRVGARQKKALDDIVLDRAIEGVEADLQGAAGEGRHAIKRERKPTPGEVERAAIFRVYGKELDAEAMRIAKRARSERPSKQHVRMAADRIGMLRDRAGVASDAALGIGSVLMGAAASYLVTIRTGGEASGPMDLAAVVALSLGIGLSVAAVVVKWRRT